METIRPYLSPTFDPHSLTIEIAQAAESLVNKVGVLEAPISYRDLEKMAAHRMIKQISKMKMNCGGSLIPIRGGFLVQLDSAQNERMWPNIHGLLSLIRKFDVSPQIMIRRLQDLESEQPKVVGDAAIYSIHVSRTEGDGPRRITARTKVWKFGGMKKMIAYNMNGPNVKVDRSLTLMEGRSLSEPYETKEVLVRGELGQIPTARYRFGCSWEDRSNTNLLAMVSAVRRS